MIGCLDVVRTTGASIEDTKKTSIEALKKYVNTL